MADDEDIVWIRDDAVGSTPQTPVTPKAPEETSISVSVFGEKPVSNGHLSEKRVLEREERAHSSTPTIELTKENGAAEILYKPDDAAPSSSLNGDTSIQVENFEGSLNPKEETLKETVSEKPIDAAFASQDSSSGAPTVESTKLTSQKEPEKRTRFEGDSFNSFNIDDYERNLQKTTNEALNLVEKLSEKQSAINQAHDEVVRALREERGAQDYFYRRESQPTQLPNVTLSGNVESVVVGEGDIGYATGALVLPSGRLLVTDEKNGLLLFTFDSQLVWQENWKQPQSPLFFNDYVLVLMQVRGEDGQWQRHIVKFSEDLEYQGKIEGPKWVRDSTVHSERISISHSENIYLSIFGEIFSALYELTPQGVWTELLYKLSESHVDMLAFSVIGPITQLLIVEGRKNFVWLVSVREHEVADRRRLYIGERPWALGRDDAGRLFFFDRATASIRLVDTSTWIPGRAVGLIDAPGLTRFSAFWGLLAIPLKDRVRLQKYYFR